MLALLGIIPGALSLIQFVVGKVFDAKVQITAARIGGDVEKAKQIVSLAQTEAHERTAWLSVVASNTLLTLLVIFFALPFGLFIWKVVVVDIIVGPGCLPFTSMCWVASTDPIRGQVAEWGNTIIIAIFGAPTTISVAKIILAKKSE